MYMVLVDVIFDEENRGASRTCAARVVREPLLGAVFLAPFSGFALRAGLLRAIAAHRNQF